MSACAGCGNAFSCDYPSCKVEPMWLLYKRRDTGLWSWLPWFLRPEDHIATCHGADEFSLWVKNNSWVGIRTEIYK